MNGTVHVNLPIKVLGSGRQSASATSTPTAKSLARCARAHRPRETRAWAAGPRAAGNNGGANNGVRKGKGKSKGDASDSFDPRASPRTDEYAYARAHVRIDVRATNNCNSSSFGFLPVEGIHSSRKVAQNVGIW